MTMIDKPLKWDLLGFTGRMGKHFFNVSTQKLWSGGTEATSQAGSLTWQCVKVPMGCSFWRYDICRDERVLNRNWGPAPGREVRGQRSEIEGAVSSAMESPGDWKYQHQGKSIKDSSKCRVESLTLGQAGCFVGSRAAGVGLLFEARSWVSSRYWTGSYRMWVYTAQVWLWSERFHAPVLLS